MKVLLLVASCVVFASAAPRDKRQLTIGTIAVSGGAGGNTGCVVTGNVLYANGIKVRELTSDEQSDLDNYETQLKQYKTEVGQRIEEIRQSKMGRVSGHRGVVTDGNANNAVSSNAVSSVNDENLPKPPQKPAFCTPELTTQYYFDGCMVQNNKVYVGREYARDLTSSEQDQLKTFDTQQTVYQNALQAQIQQQMKGFLGSDFLSALFGEDSRGPRTTTPKPTAAVAAPTPLPPKPDVPNFCTPIY